MKEEEIIEGNVLIAEFIGLESFMDGMYGKMYPNPITPNRNTIFGDAGLKYHSSFDWLMPVIQKINNLKMDCDNEDQYENFMYHVQQIKGMRIVVDIEHAWSYVVEFIKFYNQQKQP